MIVLKGISIFHIVRISTEAKENSKSKTVASSKVCQQCGFDQGSLVPFKPSNIALMESSDPEKLSTVRKFADGGEDLFGYLHSNKLGESMKLEKMKTQWKELDSLLTFKPEMPQKSAVIVKRLAEKGKRRDSVSGPEGEGSNVTIDSGVPGAESVDLSTYITMGVVDRLTAVKGVKHAPRPENSDTSTTTEIKKSMYSTVSAVPGTFASNANKGGSKRGKANLKPKPPPDFLVRGPPVRPRKQISLLTDRLYSEASEITAKRASTEKSFYSVDHKSGQPLFQPKVPELKARNQTIVATAVDANGTAKRRNIAEVILSKDEALREHRKMLELNADERIRKDMEANKVAALKRSERILDQARQRSIEEMFRLLLASTDEWVLTNKVKFSEGERAETISRISSELVDWESMQLDLSLVESNMMIPEVQSLLDAVLARQAELTGTSRGQLSRYDVDERVRVSPLPHDDADNQIYAHHEDSRLDEHHQPDDLELSLITTSDAGGSPSLHQQEDDELHIDDEEKLDLTQSEPEVVPSNRPGASSAMVPRMSRAVTSRRNFSSGTNSGANIVSDAAEAVADLSVVDENFETSCEETTSKTGKMSRAMASRKNRLLLENACIDSAGNTAVVLTSEDDEVLMEAGRTSAISDVTVPLPSAQSDITIDGPEMLSVDVDRDDGFPTNDRVALTNDTHTGLSTFSNEEVESMVVSFLKFRDLILYCLSKRHGTGKNYIYAPKKKPVVAMELINKGLAEETFAPQLDPRSAALGKRKIAARGALDASRLLSVNLFIFLCLQKYHPMRH
jgi:hypothetical protein